MQSRFWMFPVLLGLACAPAFAQTTLRLTTSQGACTFTAGSEGFTWDMTAGTVRGTGVFSGSCPSGLLAQGDQPAPKVTVSFPSSAIAMGPSMPPPRETQASGRTDPSSP